MIKKIGDLVKREILKPSFEVSTDYSNLVIDKLTDEEILGEIPIVKTFVAAVNIGLAINERHFVKKFVNFLTEFHKGGMDQEELDKFEFKMDSDPKYGEKVTELLTVMIDRGIVIEQSKVLANLFKNHIKGNIDWDRFNTLCIILDKLHPRVYKVLYNMSSGTTKGLSRVYHTTQMSSGRKDIKQYFNEEEEALLVSSGLMTQYGSGYHVSPLGVDLFEYGILPFLLDN